MSGGRRDDSLSRSAFPSHAQPAPLDVRWLLRKYGLRPDKALAQNFLIDPASLRRVVEAADLIGDEVVLEIGAGLGSLTRFLAPVSRRVVAVEFDRRLIPPLEEAVASLTNVSIVNDDVLSLDLGDLMGGETYRVVANIPYNITSILIRHLMEAPHPSRLIVLTLQREVAERIMAGPGEMSLLALSVGVYGRPSLCGRIAAGAFYPRPSVDSAVLRIDVDDRPRIAPSMIDPVFALARAGFGQKRKKLVNALASGLDESRSAVAGWLEEAGIPATTRAQALPVQDWERLTSARQGADEGRSS